MLLSAREGLLVVVDMQERLVPVLADPEALTGRVQFLLRAAAQLSVPVVASEQYPKGLGHTVADVAEYLPEGAVVEKMTFSAMREPAFRQAVETRGAGRKQAIVCGAETHVCVLQTAAELAAATRIADLRREEWANILSYPPFIDGIVAFIEENLEPEDVPTAQLRSLRKSARSLRDRETRVNRDAYEAMPEDLEEAVLDVVRVLRVAGDEPGVLPALDRLGREDGTSLLSDAIRPEMEAHMAAVFPDMCRQYMDRDVMERLAVNAREVGSLWGDGYDMPVSGILASGVPFYGLAFWRRSPDPAR